MGAGQSSLDFLSDVDIGPNSDQPVKFKQPEIWKGIRGSLEFLDAATSYPAKSGAPQLTQEEAQKIGYKHGFTFHNYPEVAGAAAASGLPEWTGGFGALVGGPKVAYEQYMGKPGEATEAYLKTRNEAAERVKAAYDQWPTQTTATDTVGGLLNPTTKVLKGATLAGRVIKNALVGAGAGAFSGSGEGNEIPGAVGGAIGGGLTGLAFGRRLPAPPGPPSPAVLANERLDVGAPIGVMTDNSVINRAYQSARSLPIVGGLFERPVARALKGMETKTAETADSLATGIRPGEKAGVGYGLQSGMADTKAFNADKANAEFDNLRLTGIDSQKKVPMAPHVTQQFDDIKASLDELGKKVPEDIARTRKVMENGASFEVLRKLRNDINKQISYDKGPFGGGQQEEYLRNTRDAITDQMEHTVRQTAKVHPDQAVKMWEDANLAHVQKMDEGKELDHLIKTGGAEGLANKALSWANTRTGNFDNLRKLYTSVSTQEWNNLAAHSVHNMGLNSKGEFTTNMFINRYAGMSEQGKNLMFGKQGTGTRQALDDISALAQKFNEVGTFANHSQTGHTVMQGGLIAAVVEHGNPVTFLLDHWSSILGPGAAAYLLTRPATADSMAKLARRWTMAIQSPGNIAGRLTSVASKELSVNIGKTLGISVNSNDLLPSTDH